MDNAPTLLGRLQELLVSYLPTRTQTITDHRNEPDSTLAGLTAERVHSAITLAEQGDTRKLFAIYRDVLIADTHTQSVIETRFLAVIGDEPLITPKNPKNPDDVVAAEALKAAIDRLPDFLGVCSDLLWGTIWPLAMVERTYRPAPELGLKFDWADITAVPDHLFRWTEGHMQIELIDPETRRPCGKWERPDPARFITHRGHLMRTPDCWGGPMRALAWWFFLKIMDREWWVRFLDKYGTPFMVGKFDKQDERSRQILERAFKLSTKVGGVVVNRETQIELLKASTGDSSEAYAKFFQTCDDAISRRVLGQTLSSTASPTGLGNGASDLQGQVRGDICGYDKKRLAQTLRNQLFKPWLRLNQFKGAVPNLTFGGEEQEENETTAKVLSGLKTAGIRVADKSLPVLSQRIGLELERDVTPDAPTETGPAEKLSKLLSATRPRVSRDPVAATDSISREAAAAITQAYRGSLAPVAQIILDAASPQEAGTKLLSAYAQWSPEKVAEIVETAITAGAWNATQG